MSNFLSCHSLYGSPQCRGLWICRLWLLGTLFSLGCGQALPEQQFRDSQLGFEQALTLEFESKHADALAEIDKVITQGGLNADQLAEAYLLRARCKFSMDDLAGGEADLETAERGSPNPGVFHWTRGVYLQKQGKTSQAKAEIAKAKKIDPQLKIR